jgi:hypothetical protein
VSPAAADMSMGSGAAAAVMAAVAARLLAARLWLSSCRCSFCSARLCLVQHENKPMLVVEPET